MTDPLGWIADSGEYHFPDEPARLPGEVMEDALTWLAEHPDSSALQIARAIGEPDRTVFGALETAELIGRCQRTRLGFRAPWLWEALTKPVEPHAGT